MRFKLSSLLMMVTLFAVTIGLGYQVHLLRQQLAALKTEVQGLKNPTTIFIGQPVNPNQPQQNRRSNSPFRLLNSNTIVHPAVEEGMKADEWQRKQYYRPRIMPKSAPAPTNRFGESNR